MIGLKREVKALAVTLAIVLLMIVGISLIVNSMDLQTARGFVVVLLLWGVVGPAGAYIIALGYARANIAGVKTGTTLKSGTTSTPKPAQVKPNVSDYLPKRDRSMMRFDD